MRAVELGVELTLDVVFGFIIKLVSAVVAEPESERGQKVTLRFNVIKSRSINSGYGRLQHCLLQKILAELN